MSMHVLHLYFVFYYLQYFVEVVYHEANFPDKTCLFIIREVNQQVAGIKLKEVQDCGQKKVAGSVGEINVKREH